MLLSALKMPGLHTLFYNTATEKHKYKINCIANMTMFYKRQGKFILQYQI